MKERGGVAATIALLIAAVVGVSYFPRTGGESGAAPQTQPPVAKPAATVPEQTSLTHRVTPACDQIAKRLKRFYRADEQVPMPPSCFPVSAPGATREQAKTNRRLGFAIAIVPNPVQTHLPLMFDRAIESIQQAAQDVNYSYDGSWFPWNDSDKTYGSLSDQLQADRLEGDLQQQPGIMVFRRGLSSEKIQTTFTSCETRPGSGAIKPDCAKLGVGGLDAPYDSDLVVLVVAEQPTGGISDDQFENTLQWMRLIQPNHLEQPLLILGPTFSGTLPSLARELDFETLKPYVKGAQIYSGTTNSETSVRWFQLFLAQQQRELRRQGGLTGDLGFRTFFEGDGLMTDRFLCYLQHEGYDLNHVAILSEDQTAFGSQRQRYLTPKNSHSQTLPGLEGRTESEASEDDAKLPCAAGILDQRPISLYYPRDIASLRSAYEQQSIFSASKPRGNVPSTSLHADLSEPASSEHDTVRTYAGQLTPLAQESVLFGITNILDSKHIEYIILRSSNSLDQLFLSEFLRRSYPSGRVVIDGADLLFRNGMQGASLRGVMLLSTYPLLSWTQDAILPIHGAQKGSYRVFAQDLSEGIYIAARELFEQLPDATPTVPISDYGPPASARTKGDSTPADKRPATWVSVVGHRQFWPVAVLNEHTEIFKASDSTHPGYDPIGSSLLTPENSQASAPAARMALPGEMTGLIVFCVFLSFWHLYCCWKGSIIRSPRARAYFAPIARLQHPFLIFLGSLLLGLLGVTLSFAVVYGTKVLALRWIVGTTLGIIAIVVSAFLACLVNYKLCIVSGEAAKTVLERIRDWRRYFLWAWIPALLALALPGYIYLTQHLTIANQLPAYWRSVYLRSGVSPLLPQVLLIIGLYAWFWFNLRGLALFGDDRPVLPKIDDLPQFQMDGGEDEVRAQKKRLVKMFRMFSQEGSGQSIERCALPLGRRYGEFWLIFLPIAVLGLWVALGEVNLRSLGDREFGRIIFFAVSLCVALILADTMQLSNTWSYLRRLLIYLDRLRLRRTFCALRGLYGGSVWKMSGNVLEERYRLISRQFESAKHLQNALANWVVTNPLQEQCKHIAIEQMAQCEKLGRKFAAWYVDLLDDELKDPKKECDIRRLAEFQEMLAATAGCIMKQVILPEWQTETQSLICAQGSSAKSPDSVVDTAISDLPLHVRAAEEFFVLPYLGFIQNVLGRVRTIAFSILSLFVATTLSVSCYPFDPLPVIGAVFLILFALVGSTMIFVYAEMSRDATLSHIANTNPGELGWNFWVKMATFGIGPLIGLLTTLFPSMTDIVVSFLQPGTQAFK